MMLKTRHKMAAAAAIAGAVALGMAAPAAAEIQSLKIKAVGTWSNLTNYYDFEKPFYSGDMTKASGGKIQTQINPITELGLKGWEVMRLLKLGVFDVAHGVYGYVASEDPALEGGDLSGASADFKQAREVVKAYEPVIRKRFNKVFNAHYLGTFRWPSQFIWCNQPINNVTDLKDKKIRVYSTTLGDFIEGVGGSAVTIAFAEVVPALQKGVADCGLTGTLPAYNAKWWQVVTHNIRIRLGYASSFLAMNMKVWNSLDGATQALFKKELKALEEEMWVATAANDQKGMDCNASGPCDGPTGGMVPIEPTAADKAKLKDVVENFVLKRWAKRCGTQKCVDEWNATIGKLSGMKASM